MADDGVGGSGDAMGRWPPTYDAKFVRDLLDAQDSVSIAHKKLNVVTAMLYDAQGMAQKETDALKEESVKLRKRLAPPTGWSEPGPPGSAGGRAKHPMLLGDIDGLHEMPHFLPGAVWTPPSQPAVLVLGLQEAAQEDEPPSTATFFMEVPDCPKIMDVLETQSHCSAFSLKGKIRAYLVEPAPYNVTDLYKSVGVWQAIARSQHFENLTLLVIVANALWIWVDTDLNTADTLIQADLIFQIMENFFCLFFSLELFIRFMAFRIKRTAFTDRWFVFDAVLVGMMILETWVITLSLLATNSSNGVGGVKNASMLRTMRLMRLARMARMARLFRAVPELLVMIKGIAAATRSVMVTLTLLGLIVYVFGVTLRQMLNDTDAGEQYFSTVANSMLSLIFYGIIMDNTSVVVLEIGQVSPISAALIFVFILLASFTVLNMLVGVMCETVHVVSATESEIMNMAITKERLWHMLRTSDLDADGNEMISKDELKALLQIPDACIVLRDLGVDVLALVDAADVIFEIEEELDYSTFMQVVMQMRNSNTVTVRDLVMHRRYLQGELEKLSELVSANFGDLALPDKETSTRKPSKTNAVPAFRESLTTGRRNTKC
mmetsp:Transcript_115159/g.365923  ORF Transcript_115159/g.365923 Transcript_115159/m.365923 type:complete len:605 (+) Transcript_115159:152-1966(+)